MNILSGLSILPILISTFSSSTTRPQITVTESEINKAINTLKNENLSTNVDTIEDTLKTNIIKFYEDKDYVDTYQLLKLKQYLKKSDYSFELQDEINLASVSSKLNLYYDNIPVPTLAPTSSNKLDLKKSECDECLFEYLNYINNGYFIGINLSRATVINLYNMIANIINYLPDAISFIKLLKNSFQLTVSVYIDKVITSIVTFINSIIALIPSGLAGNIFKVIIVILATATTIIVCLILYFGNIEKGFYVGFRCYNILKWEWKLECGLNYEW